MKYKCCSRVCLVDRVAVNLNLLNPSLVTSWPLLAFEDANLNFAFVLTFGDTHYLIPALQGLTYGCHCSWLICSETRFGVVNCGLLFVEGKFAVKEARLDSPGDHASKHSCLSWAWVTLWFLSRRLLTHRRLSWWLPHWIDCFEHVVFVLEMHMVVGQIASFSGNPYGFFEQVLLGPQTLSIRKAPWSPWSSALSAARCLKSFLPFRTQAF